MGPESILIFSLSILVVGGESAGYVNTPLTRKNLHGELKPSHPYSKLVYKNENEPYEFRRVLQEEADPKIASIASAAADATLDISKSLAKEISDAVALAVASAVAKILEEQSVSTRMDFETLSIGSDEVKSDRDVKHDSKYVNIDYPGLSIRRSKHEQPEVPYDDDKESWPDDNTSRFSALSDADQSEMEQRIYDGDETPVSNQDVQMSPNVEYQGNGVIILRHKNNTEPIHQHSRNTDHRNHPSIDDRLGDNDVSETHNNNDNNQKRNIKRRGRGRSHRVKRIHYTDDI